MTKLTKKQDKELDRQIEVLYYQHANGRQIEIMKIGKLFSYAKHLNLDLGTPLEDAVKASIEEYCIPEKI